MPQTTDRFHLVPGDDDMPWQLVREGQDDPVALLPSLRMSLTRGLDLAEAEDTSLVIHGANGRIRSIIDGSEPDDLEVVPSGSEWVVRKQDSQSVLGAWPSRNEALERALELVRERGARVTLVRPSDPNLVWRNAGSPENLVARTDGTDQDVA